MNEKFDWVDVSFIRNYDKFILSVDDNNYYSVEESGEGYFAMFFHNEEAEKLGYYDNVEEAKEICEEFYIRRQLNEKSN